MNNTHRQRWYMPLFAILLLVLATLACGNDVEPEQVGRVGDNGAVAVTEEETEAPAEEELAADSVEPEPAEEEVAEVEPARPETFAVGDVVSIGDMVLVVLGWEEIAGDQFNQPAEGQKFVAIDVLLVNQGTQSTAVSSLMQMELRDATAQRYTVDIMANAATGASSPEGEISPGERVRGKVGFQVPQDATGLQFVFDADFWGTGKVFVDLGDEPHAVEVPAEVAGQAEQVMYEVGDIVEMGDIALVVLGWESPAGDQFIAPETGMRFALIDLVFVNQGERAENLSSLLQVSLKDETDQLYRVDFMAVAASGRSSPEGELVPGERIRGQVGFQIPEDVQELVFVFDADVFGLGKVFYNLPIEPMTVAPPDTLPGEGELEMAAVGETVTLDDLAVTVNGVSNPPGDSFNRPKEGNQFVVLDITLQNQGAVAMNVSSLLQMWLKDATGQLYTIDYMAVVAAGGTPPEGEIAPGETIRGQIGFQVPVDAQNLVFAFDRDVFTPGKAFVALP